MSVSESSRALLGLGCSGRKGSQMNWRLVFWKQPSETAGRWGARVPLPTFGCGMPMRRVEIPQPLRCTCSTTFSFSMASFPSLSHFLSCPSVFPGVALNINQLALESLFPGLFLEEPKPRRHRTSIFTLKMRLPGFSSPRRGPWLILCQLDWPQDAQIKHYFWVWLGGISG